MPFAEKCEVKVKAESDMDWTTLQEIAYFGNEQGFHVPVSSPTDFASVPRMLVWFIPRYGAYTKAAILHDYLWRTAVPAGDLTLAQADGIFRRAMRELGVPFLTRWMMWGAVRLGALAKPNGTKKWARESWQVFPLLALALPIVALPALLILVALLLFFLIEEVFYAPLRIIHWLQERRQQPAKQVNAPSFDLKMT